MELRAYWQIVWKWWWLVLAIIVLVLIGLVTLLPREASAYRSVVRIAIQPMVEGGSPYYSQNYYEYLATEYLVDDVAKVIESGSFMADVDALAQAKAGKRPRGSIETKKTHRVLALTVTSPTQEEAQLIVETAADLLSKEGTKYFRILSSGQGPQVTVVDLANLGPAVSQTRTYLNWLLRLALALFAGVALAFLVDYLDDTLRGPKEVEEFTGLRVLGEVPKERRGWLTARRG